MFGTNIIFIGSMFFVTEQFQHCLFKIPSTDGFSSKDHLTLLAPLVRTFPRNPRVGIIKREIRPKRRKTLHEILLITIIFFFFPIFRIEDYPDYFFLLFPYFTDRRLSRLFFFTFSLLSRPKIIPIILFLLFPYFPDQDYPDYLFLLLLPYFL